MLVLTRKISQQIQIGDGVVITILQVKGNAVRVGIEAPREVRVVRGELQPRPEGAVAEVAEVRDPQTPATTRTPASRSLRSLPQEKMLTVVGRTFASAGGSDRDPRRSPIERGLASPAAAPLRPLQRLAADVLRSTPSSRR